MALVTAFALVQCHDLGFVERRVGVDDAAVAIRAQHIFFHVDGVIGGAACVGDRAGVRMTRNALLILDANENPNRLWIVAAHVRNHLLGPAHFFLDESGDTRFAVTIQTPGTGVVLRGLPRLVIKVHLVARIAEPGLAVDNLKSGAPNDKDDKPGGE
jgi:hypothetical protein